MSRCPIVAKCHQWVQTRSTSCIEAMERVAIIVRYTTAASRTLKTAALLCNPPQNGGSLHAIPTYRDCDVHQVWVWCGCHGPDFQVGERKHPQRRLSEHRAVAKHQKPVGRGNVARDQDVA